MKAIILGLACCVESRPLLPIVVALEHGSAPHTHGLATEQRGRAQRARGAGRGISIFLCALNSGRGRHSVSADRDVISGELRRGEFLAN